MKSLVCRLILIIAILGFSFQTKAQLTTLGNWNAYVYNPNVSAPVILAFHGQGQMGTNPSALLTDGFPKLITEGFVPPKAAFIVTPQGQWGGWDGNYTRTLLQKIKQQYPLADTSRVYLTGFSAGGKTAFEGVYIVPKKLITFATAGTTDAQINTITANRIPTYMYVGANDNQFYGITTAAAAKINLAVPNLAKLTIIPNTGHGGWNEKYRSSEFWDLIESSTPPTDPQPPVTPPTDPEPPVTPPVTPPTDPNVITPTGTYIVQVASGEYFTAYRTNTGRLFSTRWNGNTPVPYDVGISRVMDIFGAQYTVGALDSAGRAYIVGISGGTPYVTQVTTDIQGNAFTGNSKIYGLYKCYLTIRNGNVWYWGEGDWLNQNGGANLSTPKQLIMPAGKSMKKLVATSAVSAGRLTYLWGLATDGTIWQWDRSNTTPFQVIFPGNIAEDITMVDDKAFVIRTASKLYAWGDLPEYAGGVSRWTVSGVQDVTAKWTAAGCVFPLRDMAGNANSLHIIDANYNMFASGNMSQGEVGNGQELSPWRTAPNPWNWDWANNVNMIAPVQIPGKFQKVCTGNNIAFYVYAQDMGGDWYSWGRNKSFSLGNGETLAAFGGQGYDSYPNAMNVPAPTLVTPLTQTWTVSGFDPQAARPPFANAGVNQYINTSSTTLYGSGSWQQEGVISKYEWSKVSGPNATIVSPTAKNTNVTGLSNGTYIFKLTVTNSNRVSASRNVKVVVNDAPVQNQAPTSIAGDSLTITLPTNSVTLRGRGTDNDGTIASYNWSKISGPAATIASPTSATTNITGMVAGLYKFELKVTDNQGATGTSTVPVLVLPRVNQLPTANAGADQIITLPTNSVTLSGNGTDADGSISLYSWTKISGPAATITSPSSASTTVMNMLEGTYKFELKVTDNDGGAATATVQVTVLPRPNQAPSANAGANQTITLPTNTVTLTGSGTDVDGSIVSYNWVKVSGGSATITSVNSAATTVTGLTEGAYTFKLTVTDNSGASATATVQVTVLPRPNQAPTANAGSNQTITLPINTVTLSGSGTDADGTITAYTWTKISGGNASITNSNSATTTVTALIEGVYTFQLKVTDNSGATATSNVQVTVLPRVNQSPSANAGANQTITLPLNSVTVSGSGSDPDGTIVSYSWVKTSGGAATIVSPSAATTIIKNLVEGIYVFKLTVTDNDGATATSSLTVTVLPRINQAPSADAGQNQTITLPTNAVTLNGSGTDNDGTIVSFAWTKTSGGTATIVYASSSSTVVNNLAEGTYTFKLTVTDNDGATASSTVQVTVLPRPNQAPSANAGANQTITLPTNSVTLIGTGTDADGIISAYSWRKVSGPAATITSANAATTTVTQMVEGTYVFELKVTDNSGATATANVTVTVLPRPNEAPTAFAGNDQTITLPVNSVTLSGSGIDSDGLITAYSWVKTAGGTATINNANSSVTTVTGLVEGTYTFTLTVMDNSGATATASVRVTVLPRPNQLPVANAGNDQTITLPRNYVTLVGTGTDADGSIVSYAWRKTSGPAATLTNTSQSSTTVTNMLEGVYTFKLTVTDNSGATATDEIQVTVLPRRNEVPFVSAGENITITLPVNTVTLNGSASDEDGTIVSYNWIKSSGGAATIASPFTATTQVTNLEEGTYEFTLTATDNDGANVSSSVTVIVLPRINQAPSANAGNDQTITLPVNYVTLSGSGSDADGNIVAYNWRKTAGAVANIVTPNSATTTVSGLVQGSYTFELKVTDNSGATATSTVRVTVLPRENSLPVAFAGFNQTITLPVNSTTLYGSGTDTDGTIAFYNWQQVSGAPANIASFSSASTAISGLTEGVYIFKLTVTDNDGGTGSSSVQVTVLSNQSLPPVLATGSVRNVFLPVDTTTLSVEVSGAEGRAITYKWTKITGPVGGQILTPESATTTVNELHDGTYYYQVVVKDNLGFIVRDTVTVYVYPETNNHAPIANAGPDQTIYLPDNIAYLNGESSSDDLGITGYKWRIISGPGNAEILEENSVRAKIFNMVMGVYEVELTVSDGSNLMASDTVKIYVGSTRIAMEAPPAESIFPNPVENIMNVKIESDAAERNVKFILYNIRGTKVAEKRVNLRSGTSTSTMDVSNLERGVYMLKVVYPSKPAATIKFIKN